MQCNNIVLSPYVINCLLYILICTNGINDHHSDDQHHSTMARQFSNRLYHQGGHDFNFWFESNYVARKKWSIPVLCLLDRLLRLRYLYREVPQLFPVVQNCIIQRYKFDLFIQFDVTIKLPSLLRELSRQQKLGNITSPTAR